MHNHLVEPGVEGRKVTSQQDSHMVEDWNWNQKLDYFHQLTNYTLFCFHICSTPLVLNYMKKVNKIPRVGGLCVPIATIAPHLTRSQAP
jgi:hypothetical protein